MKNIQLRRAIFYGFIIVFLMSAPAIVLFTAGIRWSFEQGMTRTGTIFVTSIPRDAMIFLNDEPFNDTTPAVVKRQQPGIWEVRLELEGHLPWQKILPVSEGTTTFIDNVILFLDAEPELLIAENISNASWSPDSKNLAWADHQEGWTEIWISNLERPASTLVSRFTLNVDVQLSWIDDDILSVMNDESRTLIKRNGDSVDPDTIKKPSVTINPSDNASEVIDSTTGEVLARLPLGEYEVTDERGPYVLVSDTVNHKIALINRNDRDEPLLLLENATSAEWIREEVLLYATPFSISIYEPSKHETTLITRISNEIRDPQWHPDGGYIFYAIGNQLKVVELDDRDGRRNTVLSELNGMESFTVDQRGRTIYIVGDDGIDTGLFKRQLYKR